MSNNFLTDHSFLFFDFLIVLALSFIIGLEQRRHHLDQDEPADQLFGTDRTFTFIGILGFILFTLDQQSKILFLGGGLVISIFLAIFYNHKISIRKKYGLTSILSALITYCLAPLVMTEPPWLALLIVVTVLIFTEMKEEFVSVSKKFGKDEFITLAKFILIAGIILPNLPDEQVFSFIPLSPYKMWLAIVAVSGISYFSYLLQKFVLVKSGLLVSGMLGGLYSSTATTIILSKKSKEHEIPDRTYGAAIILATGMMYLRILILMLFFNFSLAVITYPYFLILIIILIITGMAVYLSRPKDTADIQTTISEKNPLELKLAVIFSLLFLFFSFLTNYTLKYFGEQGLNVLSYIVGFSDIDPFLLNLFQGKFQIEISFIAKATFQAIISNNILKIIATAILADKLTKKIVLAGLGLATIINILIIVFFF